MTRDRVEWCSPSLDLVLVQVTSTMPPTDGFGKALRRTCGEIRLHRRESRRILRSCGESP